MSDQFLKVLRALSEGTTPPYSKHQWKIVNNDNFIVIPKLLAWPISAFQLILSPLGMSIVYVWLFMLCICTRLFLAFVYEIGISEFCTLQFCIFVNLWVNFLSSFLPDLPRINRRISRQLSSLRFRAANRFIEVKDSARLIGSLGQFLFTIPVASGIQLAVTFWLLWQTGLLHYCRQHADFFHLIGAA